MKESTVSHSSEKEVDDFLLNKPNCELKFNQIDDINRIIQNLPNKSICGFDDISPKLVKIHQTYTYKTNHCDHQSDAEHWIFSRQIKNC